MTNSQAFNADQLKTFKSSIVEESRRLGFQQCGITDTDLGEHVTRYQDWLAKGYHGELEYMERHGNKRWEPAELVPGTLRVIALRMNYRSDNVETTSVLNDTNKAYISRYALGRDYHKLIRNRLKKLIQFIHQQASSYDFRAFVDSAPVLERAIAQKAGLGWFGKNTMLINRSAGSWFFLGEIYTNIPLPTDPPYIDEHCGSCTACLDDCPTDAFAGPYLLDSTRCISYLTIEHKGSIPEPLRPLMGNRVFGCDDCQLVCPWTKFSQDSDEDDFSPRHSLDTAELKELFDWDEATFLAKTEGSPIRRTGYENWQRNLAVALGNAPYDLTVVNSLKDKLKNCSPLVREHVEWALDQHITKASH